MSLLIVDSDSCSDDGRADDSDVSSCSDEEQHLPVVSTVFLVMLKVLLKLF